MRDLGLPTLEERRRQLRLTFLYKVVEGHIPAINIEHYLKSQRPKRTIRAKQYEDFVTKNIIENSVCSNSKCFKPIITKTENYRNSFFLKTVYDWNKLSEDIGQVGMTSLQVNCSLAKVNASVFIAVI